jgi:hypothetical protein
MKKQTLIGIGVSVVIVASAMGIASSYAQSRGYHRDIDAGNTAGSTTAGSRTWEPQIGFTGGKPATMNVSDVVGLDHNVAKTVLTDPTAFALAVPNGNYRVDLWTFDTTSNEKISVEGKQRRAFKITHYNGGLTRLILRTSVSDGELNVTFAPSSNDFKLAALSLAGNPKAASSSSTSSSSTPSSTERPTSSTVKTSTTISKSSTTMNHAPASTSPTIPPSRDLDAATVDELGEWQMLCGLSHQAKVDPIVFPNQAGASHLHSFYGNVTTNEKSTAASLMASRSTCARGMENSDHSAYWVPALMKKGDNGALTAETGGDQVIWAYYRRGGVPGGPEVQQPFPIGLRMIAGDHMATSPQPKSQVQWQCGFGGPRYDAIPTCNQDEIHATLPFPNCWNGKDLDSANHKSHMAYAAPSGACPADHPVVLPELWFEIDYIGLTNGAQYVLSTGGVYSMHGDFFAAWDPQVQRALIANCLNPRKVCEGITREGNKLIAPEAGIPPIDITKY